MNACPEFAQLRRRSGWVDSRRMSYDSVISVLTEHLRLIEAAGQTPWLTRERREAMQALNAHSPTVDKILWQLGFASISGTSLSWHRDARGNINRAVKKLTMAKEMVETANQLGRPALPLNLLHPRVASAAWSLWTKGNYRHAVADAATVVSNFTQMRVKRSDVSDRELMAQAFSDKEPEPGKARLRCPGKRNSETVRSLQQGALLFSMGTFQAIRNLAHHTIGDGDPVIEFEHLVALSIVARWVEGWNVDKYIAPLPDFTVDMTVKVAQAGQQEAGVASSRTPARPRPSSK